MVQGVIIFWCVTMCPHKNETFCLCWFLGAKAPLGLLRLINWYTKKFQVSSDKGQVTRDKFQVSSDKWQVTRDRWQVTSDKWQVTSNKWQVTSDKWHVTRDMWNVTRDLLLFTKYLLFVISKGWRIEDYLEGMPALTPNKQTTKPLC